MLIQNIIAYLKTVEQQGIHELPLDDEARATLRKWILEARKKSSLSTPNTSTEPQKKVTPHIHVTPSPFAFSGTITERLEQLQTVADHWQPAKELGTLRDTMVFATGNPRSKLMLIGEAPGYHEELQKEPFVGKAGAKLDSILGAMGIKRSDVYISNIVKFRPAMPNQTTNNRAPSDEEIEACLPIITQEIEWIRPHVIIALGGTAAKGLLGLQSSSVSALRGSFHDFHGIPVRVTYHPSYLLRNEALSERRKVWEDMLSVMEQLGIPISEKQRTYFLPQE